MQYGRGSRRLGLLIAAACLGCTSNQPLVQMPDGGAAAADSSPALVDTGSASPPDASPDLGPPGDTAPTPPRPPISSSCGAPVPAPLRRLTSTQYQRTLRELLGVAITTELPPEPTFGGFEDRAAAGVSVPLVDAWSRVADEVVAAIRPRLPMLLPCPAGIDEGCARTFITTFGLRVYRRPLADTEVAAHLRLFNQVSQLGDTTDGIVSVLRVMLQSPHFLHRPELSGAQLGDFEVATRLSFFLWGNMPDATLLGAAAAGRLRLPQDVAAQARRMLLDPRGRQGANDFFRQWLGLDAVLGAGKDLAVTPDWTSALAPALREEGYRFIQRVMFDGDGKFTSLFTSTEAIVNARLAQHYGLTINGTDWQPASLAGLPRMGLLTQGWFLGRFPGPDSNPSRRGHFVRSRLLCQEIPAEPPNVPGLGPMPPPTATTRERFEIHRSEPACASCHQLMDPLGFPFEGYDGLGRARTLDNGKPIDSSGELTGTDVDSPVTDALDLSRRLARSGQARTCLAQRWYQLALGREFIETDECRSRELERLFQNTDGDLRELVVGIATVAALAPRPPGEVGAPGPGQPLLADPKVASRMELDLIGSQISELRQRLGRPDDRETLDQHLAGLRELEKRLR
jgi:hypothetical protein